LPSFILFFVVKVSLINKKTIYIVFISLLVTEHYILIALNSATDGADYLQSILGFSAIKNGGTNGDVTFRGMFGSRIKMLVDG
ncbi:hypothetical protein, partial [Acinetobacter junii]|uniref:hypothetical protein n=1 Tax=Acinetobacter junii TaxID=40215 RepID=UPI001C0A2FE3